MASWTLKTKAVNSKILLKEVTDFIEEGLNDLSVVWSSEAHRESFVDITDDWLYEKAEENKIEQWNVICDFRNNNIKDMEQGNYVLDVYYKQHNCLNKTHLHYEIKDDGEFNFDIIF